MPSSVATRNVIGLISPVGMSVVAGICLPSTIITVGAVTAAWLTWYSTAPASHGEFLVCPCWSTVEQFPDVVTVSIAELVAPTGIVGTRDPQMPRNFRPIDSYVTGCWPLERHEAWVETFSECVSPSERHELTEGVAVVGEFAKMLEFVDTLHTALENPASSVRLSTNVEFEAVTFANEPLIAPAARVATFAIKVLF